MALLFIILITIACILLGLIVLVQNPKGGGLSGSIAGFNNQFMGVKQTTDVLEKGTWVFAAIVGILCIISTLFFKGGVKDNGAGIMKSVNTAAPQPQQPATNSVPFSSGTDTSKHK